MRFRIRNVTQEYEAQLQPTPIGATIVARSAQGKGEWKLYRDGTSQCKVWVSGLKLSDGAVLQLAVSGKQMAEILVQHGRARYQRQSERGEAVSDVAVDQMLQVSYGGEVILQGEFYEE
jgi:hypothetical protein